MAARGHVLGLLESRGGRHVCLGASGVSCSSGKVGMEIGVWAACPSAQEQLEACPFPPPTYPRPGPSFHPQRPVTENSWP